MFKTQDDKVRGITAAFAILERWRVTPDQLQGILGFPFGTQVAEWKRGDLSSMPADVVSRLALVVDIYQLLRKLPVGPNWLQLPQPSLNGVSPVARMASGDLGDLTAVRDTLSTLTRQIQMKGKA
jgi:hypothetical protein